MLGFKSVKVTTLVLLLTTSATQLGHAASLSVKMYCIINWQRVHWSRSNELGNGSAQRGSAMAQHCSASHQLSAFITHPLPLPLHPPP